MSANPEMTALVPEKIPMDRRQFAFGGVLLGLAIAETMLRPRRGFPPPAPNALEQAIPTAFGPWQYVTTSGIIKAPADEMSKRLYDQVLTRLYERPDGARVGLLIAYGSAQNSALQLHRPEYCYPAQGFTISGKRFLELRLGSRRALACLLTAETPEITEQLLYWARIDRSFTVDGAGDRAAIVHANLRGYLPDGVLVRMSTQTRDPVEATGILRDFNNALVTSLGPTGRHLVFGQA